MGKGLGREWKSRAEQSIDGRARLVMEMRRLKEENAMLRQLLAQQQQQRGAFERTREALIFGPVTGR